VAFPNLKVLYLGNFYDILGLNEIREVNETELYGLKGIKYISFGWWGNYLAIKFRQIQPTKHLVKANPHKLSVRKSQH
jgi:hypothetical protein